MQQPTRSIRDCFACGNERSPRSDILDPSALSHRLADFLFKLVRFCFKFLQFFQHLLPHRFVFKRIEIDLHIVARGCQRGARHGKTRHRIADGVDVALLRAFQGKFHDLDRILRNMQRDMRGVQRGIMDRRSHASFFVLRFLLAILNAPITASKADASSSTASVNSLRKLLSHHTDGLHSGFHVRIFLFADRQPRDHCDQRGAHRARVRGRRAAAGSRCRGG